MLIDSTGRENRLLIDRYAANKVLKERSLTTLMPKSIIVFKEQMRYHAQEDQSFALSILQILGVTIFGVIVVIKLVKKKTPHLKFQKRVEIKMNLDREELDEISNISLVRSDSLSSFEMIESFT